jgi:2-polyprenyl-3-methyl-5-hydroxy-6-metoxy-1,4-benzoquinol methylase
MKEKGELQTRLTNHIRQYGDWTVNICLPHGLWTQGHEGVPQTRLKRVLQIIRDISLKPLTDSRILDLGCLDGLYSIEFALQGADVTGIEIREANLRRALFSTDSYDLTNVKFIQDDVRNISRAKYGSYDIILCSGILYHLPVPDVFVFVEKMYEMTDRAIIIDTHISLNPSTSTSYNGILYHGQVIREHGEKDIKEIKEKRVISSIDNTTSFVFSRPSLINLLSHAGFSSIYECFNPPHLKFGLPGLEHINRCTFVAIKGQHCSLHTSPLANTLQEDWPEGSLSYHQNRLSRAWGYGRSLAAKSIPSNIRVVLRRALVQRHLAELRRRSIAVDEAAEPTGADQHDELRRCR